MSEFSWARISHRLSRRAPIASSSMESVQPSVHCSAFHLSTALSSATSCPIFSSVSALEFTPSHWQIRNQLAAAFVSETCKGLHVNADTSAVSIWFGTNFLFHLAISFQLGPPFSYLQCQLQIGILLEDVRVTQHTIRIDSSIVEACVLPFAGRSR